MQAVGYAGRYANSSFRRCIMEKNIINYYNHYEEDGRLFSNYSHQVEWLTPSQQDI